MTYPSLQRALLPAVLSTACSCAQGDEQTSVSGDGSSGEPMASSGQTSTGATFDASRFIGRYHLENHFLPFGERGDAPGPAALGNFEVLPDGRASLLYDECSFEDPILITYDWEPSGDGWLSLLPGPDEPSLRYMSATDLEALRVRLIEPCRELRFEIDGQEDGFAPFHPGESCWVDRCTTPGIMQVDYCDGEEPPPCP